MLKKIRNYNFFDMFLMFSLFTFGFRIQEIVSLLYLLLNFKRINIKIKHFIFLVILLFPSFYYMILRPELNIVNKFIQQFFIVTFCILSLIILIKKLGAKKTFFLYCKIAKLIIIFGTLQLVMFKIFKKNIFIFILGKNYILNNELSVTSICGEPGMYAQLILPYVIYRLEIIQKIKRINYFDIIVFINFFLTRTAIAYFCIGIYIFLKLFLLKNKLMKLVIFIVGISIIPFIFNSLDKYILMKITESFEVLLKFSTIDLKTVNLSTFALFSNLTAFKNSGKIMFGNGLGSIEQTYYTFFKNKNYYLYGLNSTDGYSLFVRIISEFGLVGILCIFVYISKNLNLIKKNIYGVINFSSFLGIFSYLLRGGSYFMQGTLLFLLLFLFSNLEEKRRYK